jgi:hypothetical protein
VIFPEGFLLKVGVPQRCDTHVFSSSPSRRKGKRSFSAQQAERAARDLCPPSPRVRGEGRDEGLSGSTRKWWLCSLTRIAAQSDLSSHGAERCGVRKHQRSRGADSARVLASYGATKSARRVGQRHAPRAVPRVHRRTHPIARASLHFVPLSPAHQLRQQQKKKGSGTPKDASSKPLRPPQTRLRSRRKPSAGHSARSAKRARLSASRHGSNLRSVSPLGATPGQASWDADA